MCLLSVFVRGAALVVSVTVLIRVGFPTSAFFLGDCVFCILMLQPSQLQDQLYGSRL